MNAHIRAVLRCPGIARLLVTTVLGTSFAVLAACGSGDAPPPAEMAALAPAPVVPPVGIAPIITVQPTGTTTMPGQPATFTVVATGTAPLAYQWQRGGVAIVGATSATYTLSSTALGDSGSTFRVVVSNATGSVTSTDATLTVSQASPVLSIAPQPMNQSAVAGATVSFTVGATCSSGTVTVQWQRSSGATFADIPGATGLTYTFAVASGDNDAQFRANLSCSGASAATSATATLTIAMPSSVTLSEMPIVGLREPALFTATRLIDPAPGGGWDFTVDNTIRHVAADLSSVTLVAGASDAGSADGTAQAARFSSPTGIVHAPNGAIYVVDTNNDTIRVINDGTVTTLAGAATGSGGYVDATGSAARFFNPLGIALGPDGDLYVADSSNNRIRRVTVAGVVTTYAGSGTAGFADAAVATNAQFASPYGIAIAPNGDLYVSDAGNGRIRRIVRVGNAAGGVQTVAGSGNGTAPGADGPGITAVITNPTSLALSGATLYVHDTAGLVRTVDTVTGLVGTFAGSRTLGTGYADGPLGTGQLDNEGGIATATAGGLIAVQRGALRTIDATGNVTTFAAAYSTVANDGLGTGVLAQLPFDFDDVPRTSLVVDPAGRIVVSERSQRAVRRIDTSGNVSLVAGLVGGTSGPRNGKGSIAQFSNIGAALAVAPDGTLYSSENYGVTRIQTDGTAAFLAGSTTQFGNMDGPGSAARFNTVTGLAVAPNGDVLASDPFNNVIRRIDAAGNTSTYISGIAGSKLVTGPDGTLYVATTVGIKHYAANGTALPTLAAPADDVAVDAAGHIFSSNRNGAIFLVDPMTGAPTQLIGTGSNVVLGNLSPSLGPDIGSIYAYAPKQLLVISQNRLLLLTIP